MAPPATQTQPPHPGWLTLQAEIALIAFAAVITLLLVCRGALVCHRRWKRRQLAALGQRLEQDWLHEGLPAEKRVANGGARGEILVGTENPDEAWTSTLNASRSGRGMQTSLLSSMASSSSDDAGGSGGDLGGSGERSGGVGWRLMWRDNARRSAPADYASYTRVRVLGRGANGTAVLLRHKRTDDQVVCKELPLQGLEASHLTSLQNEVCAISRDLPRSPYISRYLPRPPAISRDLHPSRRRRSRRCRPRRLHFHPSMIFAGDLSRSPTISLLPRAR